MNTRTNILRLTTFALIFVGLLANLQAADKGPVSVGIQYFFYNNQLPFLRVTTKTKIEKKWKPVGGIDVTLFLDGTEKENLIGKVKTDEFGRATIAIPRTLQTQWDSSVTHIFYAVSAANKLFEESESELEIIRAQLVMDTLNDGESKSITAKLMEMTETGLVPAPEADLILGVKRLGSILSAGTDNTFATDEEGVATALFERSELPGDKNGGLILVAKLDDHELYGTLIAEIPARWGTPLTVNESATNKRALWGSRKNAPIWLLIAANSILALVWGVLIFLIFQLFKIKKLGNA